MSRQFESFTYELPELQYVGVNRIQDPEQIGSAEAYAALVLLAKTYGQQFEEPLGDMPRGTFAKHFKAEDDNNVLQQKARMHTYVANGSHYWFIPDGPYENPYTWRGVAKTSPSRATIMQKAHLQPPNCYLNDLVVDPIYQREGYGSVLLHAAITQGGFDPEQSLALDAYEGNDLANAWFQRLGMHATRAEVAPRVIGGSYEMSQVRYSSEGQTTLGEIINKLEHAQGLALTATHSAAV